MRAVEKLHVNNVWPAGTEPPLYLPGHYFTRRLYAARLENHWQEFNRHRETFLQPEVPLGLEASRLPPSNPYWATRAEAERLTGRLFLFPFLVELRRLHALGLPQPRTLDDFSPELQELIKPFRPIVDWQSDGITGVFTAGDWKKTHTFEKGQTWNNV